MARVFALVLIVGTMIAVQQIRPAASASSVALPLGFSLIAAYLLGGAAERLRLPRLSGYLLFGMACGPFLLNLITAPMARELQVVNGFALALIALVAGLELNAARLRPQIGVVLGVGGIVIGGVLAALSVTLWAAWPWLSLPAIEDPTARFAAALVTSTLVASFSPTVTMAVIAESRARGPLTDLVVAIVVLADLVLILVFSLSMQLARWASSAGASGVSLGVRLSWEIFGSLAFGAIVGALFALYLRHVRRELTLALLGVCAVLAVGAPLLHFELILASLAAGLVVENIAPPEGDELKVAIERSALPVLIVFFAAAGASLQLDVLAVLGGTALVLAGLRIGLIRGFTWLGVWAARRADTEARFIWMGLVSQAGVTLGLGAMAASAFPEWGPQVRTLVVALIGLNVLVGPILLKDALRRSGEIGQADRGAAPAV